MSSGAAPSRRTARAAQLPATPLQPATPAPAATNTPPATQSLPTTPARWPKTGCSVVTYTAIFGSMEAPEESTEPESGSSTASAGVDLSTLKAPLLIGGGIAVLAASGAFVFKKLKERR